MASNMLSGMSILVVEDQILLLRLMEDMLGDLGCANVIAAANIEQALTQIYLKKIDAVALDINLNGTMSFEVADVLVEKAIPFIFVTGYGTISVPAAYESRPALRKPYRAKDLAAAFASLLALQL
jgi:CheY-like chemotaxis protein